MEIIHPFANPHKTQIFIDAEIPIQQEVKYIPGILQTLKFAWIQYLSIAVFFVAIFTGVVGFIFRHKIVDTAMSSDFVGRKKY